MEHERRLAVMFSAGAVVAAMADLATDHRLAGLALAVFLTPALTMWLRVSVASRRQRSQL